MAGHIVVGTAGWSAAGFAQEWYPAGLPARDRLSWYAERFEGVEVDSTFYALPARGTAARWARVTPARFTFDVKLHRLLSRHAAPLSSLPTGLRERANVHGGHHPEARPDGIRRERQSGAAASAASAMPDSRLPS
jgi:uncharacterized protein YecE (DUF72 family)